MSYKILWTSEAFSTFEDRISYLQIHFTDREINNFKKRVGSYLLTLSEEPLIGKRTGRQKAVHIGHIIKRSH